MLAAKTAENCRIWRIDSTPRNQRHAKVAYVPVQSRARLDAMQERARRSAKPRSAAEQKRSRTFIFEHSGAVCANCGSYSYRLQQSSTHSASETSRNRLQLAAQAWRTLSRYHWSDGLEDQTGGCSKRPLHQTNAPCRKKACASVIERAQRVRTAAHSRD